MADLDQSAVLALRLQLDHDWQQSIGAGSTAQARALEAQGWRAWLATLAPRTFTGSFANFHVEFWDWFWPLLLKRQGGQPLTNEDLVFLAIWGRGQGKSSHVEWAAIAEGALIRAGYVLYVSGTQTLAEGHVTSIRERLESEEVGRYYPHLSNPQMGRHGNQYGWRQDFLRTEGGWAIRPIGLDVGVRGGRVGDLRPTLIIGDDVDDHADSPLVVQKKLDTISRSIIPAGTKDTVILGAQNLIHRNSVFNQIVTRRTDVLADRRISGPFPAFEGLGLETRQTDRGPREIIVAGSPTWADIDRNACQKFLDNSGRAAFLAEYQHDFSASEQGRVIPEYDEGLHVITWSDFERVYGARYIPEHWRREVGHDVGFTIAHQSAWTWIATSAMNSALPGKRFRYRGVIFTGVGVDEQAEVVLSLMYPECVAGWHSPQCAGLRHFDELPLIECWRASHEALSERMTYRAKHNLPFIACDSAKTAGVSQWRHYLRVDRTQPHPFKEDEKVDEDHYRIGSPAMFDIVDDDQLHTPRDDRGLRTHRRETVSWRYRPDVLGVGGLSKSEPMKLDENSCDSTRMITATWGPEATLLTADEEFERSLPVGHRRETVEKLTGDERDLAEIARSWQVEKRKKEDRREVWSSGVIDPADNPWGSIE